MTHMPSQGHNELTHCDLVMPYGQASQIFGIIGSGKGQLSNWHIANTYTFTALFVKTSWLCPDDILLNIFTIVVKEYNWKPHSRKAEIKACFADSPILATVSSIPAPLHTVHSECAGCCRSLCGSYCPGLCSQCGNHQVFSPQHGRSPAPWIHKIQLDFWYHSHVLTPLIRAHYRLNSSSCIQGFCTDTPVLELFSVVQALKHGTDIYQEVWDLGANSIQRWHLTSIGNPLVEMRQSYLNNGIPYTGKTSLHSMNQGPYALIWEDFDNALGKKFWSPKTYSSCTWLLDTYRDTCMEYQY